MAPVETAYYDLLQVSPAVTAEELAAAYKKSALRLHPDKGGSAEEFKAMKVAYDVLKDPQKRKLYDAHGAAIIRVMDGETLEPEVMMEATMSIMKIYFRKLLIALPFIAVLLFLPAIALALKWDHRISWNWNVVFIPMWLGQIILLVLILMLRSYMSSTVDSVFEEDEVEEQEDHAASEQRKRMVKHVFTVFACIVLLVIFQEVMLAGKLQGYMGLSWFLVLIPYLAFEMLWLFTRFRVSVAGPPESVIEILAPAFAWGAMRLCTWLLFALKADDSITCSWVLCLIPLMIAAVVRLLWACRPVRQRAQPLTQENEEDEPPSSNGFTGACIAIGSWLSILVLGAAKLDGSTFSAFLVFLPFFLISTIVLCCCTCLACCGPNIIRAALSSDFEEQARGLNPNTNASTPQDYSTMPREPQQDQPV